MKKTLPELSERLKKARGSRSQKAVAEACGMKQQEWARYEHGDVVPRADKLQQICRALALSADWLLGLSPARGGVGDAATDAELQDIRKCLAALTQRVEALSSK